MRLLVRAFSLTFLLIISCPSSVSADPILVTDRRRVAALALIGDNFPTDAQTPSAPFAPFVGTASASVVEGLSSGQTVTTQSSSFGPRVFSASGTVDSSATGSGEFLNPGSTVGSSLFDFEFDLANPHRFLLKALLAVDRIDPFGTEGFGEVDVLLISTLLSGDFDIVISEGIRFGRRELNVTGILPAGRHRFSTEAFTESLSFGELTRHSPRFDLEFEVQPVPEPGSLMLLGGGLLALASRRLRR